MRTSALTGLGNQGEITRIVWDRGQVNRACYSFSDSALGTGQNRQLIVDARFAACRSEQRAQAFEEVGGQYSPSAASGS